uniref:H(+)-exporting diphosphatase n=1 Tax=Tanacetum cinerariifolium TaxID=118510 RepID=A0A6L2MHZ7_TANCI|nr:H+-translocating pyrophosphatase [Tanacetum cinerariifolium]
MSQQKITDVLDATKNTTKATTKGFAIGSAALSSFLLSSAYMDEVDIAIPEVFVGGLLGSIILILFSAWACAAVGQTAHELVNEVGSIFRRTSLTGFLTQSIRSSNVIALGSPYLLVLITGTSQSRQQVDTSLIHLESRKSPTAELFNVDSGRISIHHDSISAHLLFGTRRLERTATSSISTISE